MSSTPPMLDMMDWHSTTILPFFWNAPSHTAEPRSSLTALIVNVNWVPTLGGCSPRLGRAGRGNPWVCVSAVAAVRRVMMSVRRCCRSGSGVTTGLPGCVIVTATLALAQCSGITCLGAGGTSIAACVSIARSKKSWFLCSGRKVQATFSVPHF